MGGYPDGTYRPERPITRGQAATLLHRYNEAFPSTSEPGPAGPQGPAGERGPAGPRGPAGSDAIPSVHRVQMGAATPIAIGGSIKENGTVVAEQPMPAGRYLVFVDGAFSIPADIGFTGFGSDADGNDVQVLPQLSLWSDHDGDGVFDWQTEGSISPNAQMPAAVQRHISVAGSSVLTLEQQTTVRLLAHGYTSTGGNEGSGQIHAIAATLTAAPIQ